MTAVNSISGTESSSGNKGTFGKASVVAGSNGMAGAAILAARAAYRTGAGMVKVITAEENRQILQQGIPEALYGSCRQLSESLEWADVIAVGPGIGREEQARECLKKVVEKSRKPLVLDADALNLLAEENGKALAEKLHTREQRQSYHSDSPCGRIVQTACEDHPGMQEGASGVWQRTGRTVSWCGGCQGCKNGCM